jgi:hypothetical protein
VNFLLPLLDETVHRTMLTTLPDNLTGSDLALCFQAQFAAKNRENVNINLRSSYSELAASLWLSIRLQVGLQ